MALIITVKGGNSWQSLRVRALRSTSRQILLRDQANPKGIRRYLSLYAINSHSRCTQWARYPLVNILLMFFDELGYFIDHITMHDL